MTTLAIYNMKGGVGKTTTAVNVSYAAAASGRRTLLWDLDPQAAASFSLRVRPRVSGFRRHSLEDGEALAAAIKETDYPNLYLLPADFAYRKFERFLSAIGKPTQVMASLLNRLGHEFDVVVVDCPAGFALVIEGVLAAADAVLVPTIPTVLSLRTLARLIKWADRSDLRAPLTPFFNMVDRRKALHRHACEWSMAHPQVFLWTKIPYVSVVEQMAIRRLPLAQFAPREAATRAFADIWTEMERLDRHERGSGRPWPEMLDAIESLIRYVEPDEDSTDERSTRDDGRFGSHAAAAPNGSGEFVHVFDTERRDLDGRGYCLELTERSGSFFLVARGGGAVAHGALPRAQAQIDRFWAVRILSGEMSPLAALEQRLAGPGEQRPAALDAIRTLTAGRTLVRVDTRMAGENSAAPPLATAVR